MIELNNIGYSYEGIEALNNINLSIKQGETVVLAGPNGCGKTTLLKLLVGLITPSKGTYCFEGRELKKEDFKDMKFSKKFHQQMGFVFQNAEVMLFNNNVYDEVAFGPRQMQLSTDEIEKRTNDCLNLLEIKHLKDRAPYQLSGGEKKKVALAAVLAMNPEIILFDEPLAGLDGNSKQWITGFLLQLKNAGKTIIIATHDEDLTEKVSDRVIYLTKEHTIA